MRNLLIQAWNLFKFNDDYFINYSHYSYLKFLEVNYDKITLISPIKISNDYEVSNLCPISGFFNVNVVELPYYSSYLSAIPHFFIVLKVYSRIDVFSHAYSRFPSPFGWLQFYFLRDAKRIVHYVGDPVHALLSNPNENLVKKYIFSLLFQFEFFLFLLASRNAKVFANGDHLRLKLERFGIRVHSVVSSTLIESDYLKLIPNISFKEGLRLLYVGYLRREKGIDKLLREFVELQKVYSKVSLTIVGDGVLMENLFTEVSNKSISNVTFLGHIDDRNKLLEVYRTHHVFCFPSLSEGSPRVVLEAMANGLLVVSTSVGSLPYTFIDRNDIIFYDFNSSMLSNIVQEYCLDQEKFTMIKNNALLKARNYSRDNFLKTVFL